MLRPRWRARRAAARSASAFTNWAPRDQDMECGQRAVVAHGHIESGKPPARGSEEGLRWIGAKCGDDSVVASQRMAHAELGEHPRTQPSQAGRPEVGMEGG